MVVVKAPAILTVLADGPNLITYAGALCGMAGLISVVYGALDLGLAMILWAHVADSLDGWLARKQSLRAPDTKKAGAHLDSFTDFLAGGAFPLVFLAIYGQGEPISLIGGVLLCSAGLLRLSYFNVHGLNAGAFVGMPLPHNIFPLAAGYWALTFTGLEGNPAALGTIACITAALHVGSFPFPKMSDAAVLTTIVVAAVTTVFLGLQA